MSHSSNLSPLKSARIDLQIDDAYAAQTPVHALIEAAQATLEHQNVQGAELTLVIAGDELLHQLNQQFLGVDTPTDVLSFPNQEERPGGPSFVTAPEALQYLGDVVISFPTAAQQASAAGHDMIDELRLLTVHGVLHLLGFDHGTPQEEAAMWAVQGAVLESLKSAP